MASQRFTELHSSLSLARQDAGVPGPALRLDKEVNARSLYQSTQMYSRIHSPNEKPVKLFLCAPALTLIVESEMFSWHCLLVIYCLFFFLFCCSGLY